MGPNNTGQSDLENQYRNAKDVNELISIFRNNHIEINHLSADSIPLDDDAAFDVISGFICSWILLCGQLPIDSREKLNEAVQSLIDYLYKFQSHLLSDPSFNIDKDLLHLLKRVLIRPGTPLY